MPGLYQSPKPGRIKYPGEDQEQARADQARDQVAEPGRPANGDAELGEEPAPDPGADHAEDDVGEDAHIAAGDLLRQPARHAADQDSGNPTDPSLVHRPSPIVVRRMLSAMSRFSFGRRRRAERISMFGIGHA